MATSILASKVIQHASCYIDVGTTEVVVGYLIGGIVPSRDPFAQCLETPGIPVRGEQHPDWPVTLTAQRFCPRPFKNSRSKMWLLVTYRPIQWDPIEQPSIEFRAQPIQKERCYDPQTGEVLWVDAIDKGAGIVYPLVAGRITVPCSAGCLIASWTESSDPEKRLLPLFNKFNASPWRGGAKWTWWVKDLSFGKIRGDWRYRINAEIAYDPETWIQTILYRDRFGHVPPCVELGPDIITKPPGWTMGAGYRRVLPGLTANLDDLQIPSVS